MNRLAATRQAAILRTLVEGNSVRATARMTGCDKDTVLQLLRDVGAHCKNDHDRYVTNVDAKRVQCDEIWAFVQKKECRVPEGEVGHGDVWTFTALDADTKLMLAYRVGNRDSENTHAFIQDVCDRIEGRVRLTTDGFAPYLYALEKACGWAGCDCAQLVKQYGPSPEPGGKYSPAQCVGCEKRWVMGQPDNAHISTSFVERANLTIRMGMRRFTRLTNGFSKKAEYHLYSVALHFMHYNYCRPHQTLTKGSWRPDNPGNGGGAGLQSLGSRGHSRDVTMKTGHYRPHALLANL